MKRRWKIAPGVLRGLVLIGAARLRITKFMGLGAFLGLFCELKDRRHQRQNFANVHDDRGV